ncbi:hypothetical protein C7V51_08970 [Rathayibacter iranicus]|uniref:Transposase Helix-turn-helix domain-containing protein n=2 Tax=Rathayibacter iranicus TaxID=59737 RepID=A0AAD1EMD7_9MICO|nr:hypothetical protein C7V51_08970 [Rathayibacter iranicus]PPI71533.1 hypothetical protein C5E01_07925 [Rathayibacter iranicus]
MEEQHVTLLYYRQNITEQLIADLVGIHQPTMSGTIALVKAMLNVVVDDEQPHVEAALGETTAVINDTLLPGQTCPSCTPEQTRPQGTTARSSRISPVG